MAWLPAYIICCAITASVQGLPGITRHLDEEFYSESQRGNKEQFFQHVPHHLVKDKISMHESSTIEFIYQGQNKNLKSQKGTDQEIYTDNSNSIALNNNNKKNKTETISQSDSKDSFTKIVNTNGLIATTASKKGIQSFKKTFLKENEWLFNTKEASSSTRSLPKYLYGILQISAFPGELSVPKETIVLKNEKLKNVGVPMTQKTSQPQIAGPMPYPQSTYAREFDIPFYD